MILLTPVWQLSALYSTMVNYILSFLENDDKNNIFGFSLST